jgi:hypothetical protein
MICEGDNENEYSLNLTISIKMIEADGTEKLMSFSP